MNGNQPYGFQIFYKSLWAVRLAFALHPLWRWQGVRSDYWLTRVLSIRPFMIWFPWDVCSLRWLLREKECVVTIPWDVDSSRWLLREKECVVPREDFCGSIVLYAFHCMCTWSCIFIFIRILHVDFRSMCLGDTMI